MSIKATFKEILFKSFFISSLIYDNTVGRIQERKNGVDFLKNVYPENLGENYNYNKYVHYVPSKSWQIRRIVKKLKITDKDSIFDYGCGKGKALFEFSKYKFKKIGGVELDEELVNIAKKNMQKLKLPHIEIYNENALSFKDLDHYNHFYFFDPFNIDIFKSILEIIIENCKKNPREITIIYMNLRGHDRVLDSIEGFSKLRIIQNPMRCAIYKYLP